MGGGDEVGSASTSPHGLSERKKEISALPREGDEVAPNSTFGEVRHEGDVNSQVAN